LLREIRLDELSPREALDRIYRLNGLMSDQPDCPLLPESREKKESASPKLRAHRG
jgi:hypothetical protein